MVASRGYRNNNPGNLRPLAGGVKWQGQVGIDAGNYLIFDTMTNGIRAMTRDLKTKLARGLNTIAKILYVYAPAADNNNVEAYISSVCEYAGIERDQVLTAADLYRVVPAMMRHELGVAAFAMVSSVDISNGIGAA